MTRSREDVKLTKREYEVLEQITQGRSSTEIAELFGVQKRTVDNHLCNLYNKLEVSNEKQAIHMVKILKMIS